jgi:hypothetical protein
LKTSMRLIIYCLLLILFITAGCSQSAPIPEEPEPVEEDNVEEVIEAVEEDPRPEGMAASPLTGLWIPEEMVSVRPVAMQINNSREAYPQSGIAQADLIYETLAEGNITRLMAVFHHYDAPKIGPIRSARHYYLDMAANHDALYMHYGGSPQAYAYISQMKAPAMDGLPKPNGVLSWRDPERRAIPRMLEHSVYTSKELIEEAWEKAGYRREVREDFASGLEFKREGSAPFGQRADYVTIPFSSSYTSTFEYDPETREYIKYQTGALHMDEQIEKPLRFTNLIVQRTEVYVIPGDDAGRREVKIIGQGTGHYMSHGRAVAIEWSKSSYGAPTLYIETKTGKPLMMNPGKTYIAIAPERMTVTLVKPEE